MYVGLEDGMAIEAGDGRLGANQPLEKTQRTPYREKIERVEE